VSRVRKVFIVLVLVLAAMAMVAGPAGAIVHRFTPVECANSDNAGGVQAADDNPQFNGEQPVPESSSGGKTEGKAEDAPANC
jgi:hypothetical protein